MRLEREFLSICRIIFQVKTFKVYNRFVIYKEKYFASQNFMCKAVFLIYTPKQKKKHVENIMVDFKLIRSKKRTEIHLTLSIKDK